MIVVTWQHGLITYRRETGPIASDAVWQGEVNRSFYAPVQIREAVDAGGVNAEETPTVEASDPRHARAALRRLPLAAIVYDDEG